MGSIDLRLMWQYFAAMKHTAEFFKSLADETRLRLLLLLHDGREHCVCDLMHALDMPQSTVSRHLAYLKRSGWPPTCAAKTRTAAGRPAPRPPGTRRWRCRAKHPAQKRQKAFDSVCRKPFVYVVTPRGLEPLLPA